MGEYTHLAFFFSLDFLLLFFPAFRPFSSHFPRSLPFLLNWEGGGQSPRLHPPGSATENTMGPNITTNFPLRMRHYQSGICAIYSPTHLRVNSPTSEWNIIHPGTRSLFDHPLECKFAFTSERIIISPVARFLFANPLMGKFVLHANAKLPVLDVRVPSNYPHEVNLT